MDRLFIESAEAHLGKVLGLSDFRISSAEQISGNGLSRSVVKLMATSAQQSQERGFVLLLEQPTSPVAPNRDAEFAVLRALADTASLKVAPAYWVEPDPAPLGAAFLLTGLLPGTTNPAALLKERYLPISKAVIEESYAVLGTLAALDLQSVDLGPAFSVPKREDVWRIELDCHERIIRDCGCADLLVTTAALRFLRSTPPPPPAEVSIVHGDYRVGNFLFDPSGLTGIIDWEMVHLGDPLEDLAWSLLPLWDFASRPGQAGGFLSRREAEAAWESTSGVAVDAGSLAWWTLLCHVKAVGIWATARHMFASGRQTAIMPALVGYAMIEKQESWMVDLLRGMTR